MILIDYEHISKTFTLMQKGKLLSLLLDCE